MAGKSEYKRHTHVGVGGWKCTCCAPPPGPEKKQLLRSDKRRERSEAMKEARKELEDVGTA